MLISGTALQNCLQSQKPSPRCRLANRFRVNAAARECVLTLTLPHSKVQEYSSVYAANHCLRCTAPREVPLDTYRNIGIMAHIDAGKVRVSQNTLASFFTHFCWRLQTHNRLALLYSNVCNIKLRGRPTSNIVLLKACAPVCRTHIAYAAPCITCCVLCITATQRHEPEGS